MEKVKFLVLEGADGTGKSTLLDNLVQSGYPFKEFNFRWDESKRLHIDAEEKIPMLLRAMEHFDPRFVYVMDRFLISDIVYNTVLRGEDVTLYGKHLEDFRKNFNVLYVILQRRGITEDYEDKKIFIRKKEFNDILQMYNSFESEGPNKTWTRDLTDAGFVQTIQSKGLEDELIRLYFSEKLLQQQHTDDLWRFFLCCIALNNTNGQTARRVMGQFFYEFRDPASVHQSRAFRVERILAPLGMQKLRTRYFIGLSELFSAGLSRDPQNVLSRKQIIEIPGLGKYAADSYDLFILKPTHFVPQEPFDKELRKVYESLVNSMLLNEELHRRPMAFKS